MTRRTKILFITIAAAVLLSGGAHAADLVVEIPRAGARQNSLAPDEISIVIYQDNFDGVGDLGGTAPDVRPGTEVWTSPASTWGADGTLNPADNANFWLPFVPQSGFVYSLRLQLDPDPAAVIWWLAVEFAQVGTATDFWEQSNGAGPWMLQRQDDSSTSVLQTFSASNIDPQSINIEPDFVGPLNLEVVLDTRPGHWEAQWFVEGTPPFAL